VTFAISGDRRAANVLCLQLCKQVGAVLCVENDDVAFSIRTPPLESRETRHNLCCRHSQPRGPVTTLDLRHLHSSSFAYKGSALIVAIVSTRSSA